MADSAKSCNTCLLEPKFCMFLLVTLDKMPYFFTFSAKSAVKLYILHK